MTTEKSPSALLAECAAMLDEFERVHADSACPIRIGCRYFEGDEKVFNARTLFAGPENFNSESVAEVSGICLNSSLQEEREYAKSNTVVARGLANAYALVLSRNALPEWLAYARKRLEHLKRVHEHAIIRDLWKSTFEPELLDLHALLTRIKEHGNG